MQDRDSRNQRPKAPFIRPEKGDEVVITGMAGKFPDSHNIYNFRDNLFKKVNMVSGDFRRWTHKELPLKTGKLLDIQKFDPGFFGVTTSQAESMDPMVRMVLERAIETVIDAGHHPSDLENTNTAVFVGSCFSETEECVFYENLIPTADAVIGTQRSMIAKWISYHLKLKAPACIMDTACSSSMYAFEQAYIAIKEGLCDKAIVCGTHLCLHPMMTLQFSRLGVLSIDASCKSFDDSGNGYARAEAIVVILLEKAKNAKRIYCEVVHSKANSDGYKKEGITFPSSDAQKTLLKDFYNECKIDPAVITFVEAHGTGTIVGDPEELNTLDEIFCKRRGRPLHIGAVKSNMGHSEPASGLCSIVKVVIAMETGFIPSNINYEKPRKGIKALEQGRLVVATEKMPLPDQNGYIAVNNFGFGGSNSHILLHWNLKMRKNEGTLEDDFPRLICVSGRNNEGVKSILNDFSSRKCDVEYAYLIHQIFRKSIMDYVYRGYAIYDENGEIERSLVQQSIEKKKIYLVFNHFDKEWLKMGLALMKIPIFAKSIKSIQNILSEVRGATVVDVMSNSKKDTPINQIIGTVAVQIGLANIIKEIKLSPYRIVGIGSGELVAAYVDDCLTLKQTVLGLFYIASNLFKEKDWDRLQKVFPSSTGAHKKWIPINEENLYQNIAKYFADNIIVSSYERDFKKLLRKDAVPLVIGPVIGQISVDEIDLIDVNSKDYILDLLTSLGRLHQHGFDIELDKLYPPIQLPVSRGTPMLSPLIKWNHQRDYKVCLYHHGAKVKSESTMVNITSKMDEWRFIAGHTIDGRNLFPATGYLLLAWESLAVTVHKPHLEMKVVFEDVKFIRAANVPKDGQLVLVITIQLGKKIFEITEGGVSIVTGKIYEKTDIDDTWDIPTLEDERELGLSEKDVYKELRIRGYQYTGEFRGIKKCSIDAAHAVIEWKENWIVFMDCLLQLTLLQQDSRSLLVPTSIQRLVVDSPAHIAAAREFCNMIPVRTYKDLGVLRSGGIELRAAHASAIPRRKGGDPVLEISKFVPNTTRMNIQNSIRSFVQLILENTNVSKVKVIEVCSEEQTENDLVCLVIQKALDDVPLIQQDIVVLAKQSLDLPRVTVQNKSLDTESNCLILVVSNILENVEALVANNVVKGAKGFIISKEESHQVDLAKFSGSPYTVLCSNFCENETLVLLRPIYKSIGKTHHLDLANALDNLDSWIPKLQTLLNEDSKVLLYVQDDDLSGILGLVTCLRREPYGSKISCVFIMDDAPKFNPELNFYKEQLDKGFVFNIWKNGAWGTYRHLLLPEVKLVEREHCYVNVTTRGDLSTLSWLEGHIDTNETTSEDEETVHIYYSALNFRDLMIASGKIPPEVVVRDRIGLECVQGFEFAGRNLKGERVVGMGTGGALATLVQCKKLLLRIPDDWTMEDAATVMVVYGTVIEAFNKANLKAGQTILIHSGTGGVGQAAINLSLYYGLTVFVTVGTREKREFLKQHYPQIEEEHIFNSRDTSFEEMILHCTNGRGVDYILNSLAEEKLVASIRCLAEGGKFFEIGKFDFISNNALALQLLKKDAEFIGIALDTHINTSEMVMYAHGKQIQGLIDCGTIKPLPRTVFQKDEVEKAYRYMGMGKHIGKVLIKIRDEEDQKVCHVPKNLLKATPRFYCKPESSYLICGGLGGFGLELADLLVMRGAKKLVLTSRSGLSNGYQKFRIRMWKNYGVTVAASIADASTEAGCIELLNLANKMGPVDGIFNLAVVLKDALFENLSVEDFKVSIAPKAVSTKNLDSNSRGLCPNLRYFIIFSSISCGRGNVSQTNYGMANSVMERICEKRKGEGYPALAIQWGAIGEVGLVAKMQEDHRELVIGGTLQQRISSCLQVMDKLIAQNEPIVSSMLVAEKRYGGHASSLFEAVTNILGLTNLKSVSLHTVFPELGMESIMAVEIKQILESEYEVFLTAQDIRGMTLSKLKDLSNNQNPAGITTHTAVKDDIPIEVKLLLRIIGNEEFANAPMIKLQTLIKEHEDGPHVIALPGIEGMAAVFEPLAKKLNAHVFCLQFCTDYRADTIKKLAEYIFPLVEFLTQDLILLAYSFGAIVATELLRMLEAKGKTPKIIFVEGSPEFVVQMINALVPVHDDNQLHTMMVFMIMRRKRSLGFPPTREKIDYLLSVSPKIETSRVHILNMYASIYDKLTAVKKYQYDRTAIEGLNSSVTLFKAKSSSIQKVDADYGLSKIFRDKVEVVTIEGDHATILESDDLAKGINGILQGME